MLNCDLPKSTQFCFNFKKEIIQLIWGHDIFSFTMAKQSYIAGVGYKKRGFLVGGKMGMRKGKRGAKHRRSAWPHWWPTPHWGCENGSVSVPKRVTCVNGSLKENQDLLDLNQS